MKRLRRPGHGARPSRAATVARTAARAHAWGPWRSPLRGHREDLHDRDVGPRCPDRPNDWAQDLPLLGVRRRMEQRRTRPGRSRTCPPERFGVSDDPARQLEAVDVLI